MPNLAATTTKIALPMKLFVQSAVRFFALLVTTFALSSTMPSASLGQTLEWNTIDLKPIVANHIGESPSTIVWPLLSIWKDTVWVIECRYRREGESRGEHVVIESIDAGLTWQTLSRIPERDLGKSNPEFRIVFYTPRGTLVATGRAKNYQFDRTLLQWVQTWDSIPAELVAAHDPTHVEDAQDLILHYGTKSVISKDDGKTFQETSGIFNGLLPDGTQFRFGYRLRPGWSTPDFSLPETEPYRLPSLSTPPFWAEPVGLALQLPFIGDDDASHWDKVEGGQGYGMKMARNGVVVDISSRHRGVYLSADYGRTFDTIYPAGNKEYSYAFVTNTGGQDVFFADPTYVIYRSRDSVMPQTLRWPKDSATNRHKSVTLVCPANLAGEIRVQVATSPAFDELLVDSVVSRRNAKVTDLRPYTTYFWRFAHRTLPADSWGPWSTTWSFSTGSHVVWRHIGSRKSARSTSSLTYRLSNGHFVQTAPANNAIFVSQNKGKTWDSILVIPSAQPVSHIWESPGKRLVVRAGNSLYSIDVDSRSIVSTTETPVSQQRVAVGQSIFGTSNTSAFRSHDDGRTWQPLKSWGEWITGVDVDSRGRVLFGTQYTSEWVGNQYGPTHMEWFGGLRRFDPQSGVMEQVTPNRLKYSTQFVPAYWGMRLADDGLLYSIGNVTSENDFTILVSTDEGTTWLRTSDSLAPFSPAERSYLANDANSHLVAWNGRYEIMRRVNGKWEDIGSELVSGIFPNSAGRLESLSLMPDGTFIANNRYYVDYDPAYDAIRPVPHQQFDNNEPIAFSWTPIPNAQSYTLEIPTSDLQFNTSAPNFVADGLVPPGSHTWRVRALLRDGRTSKWTILRFFSVGVRTSIQDASQLDEQSRSFGTILTRSSLLASLNGSLVDAVDVLGRPIQRLESIPLPQLIFIREGNTTRQVLLVE